MASALRPAVTIARSSAGRLIPVAQTKGSARRAQRAQHPWRNGAALVTFGVGGSRPGCTQQRPREGERRRLGDRIDSLEAGYRPIQGRREYIRAGVGAGEAVKVPLKLAKMLPLPKAYKARHHSLLALSFENPSAT